MSGRSDGQVREFARSHRACWPAYVPTVLEAPIDSFVPLVVLGQDRSGVAVEEVRDVQPGRRRGYGGREFQRRSRR